MPRPGRWGSEGLRRLYEEAGMAGAWRSGELRWGFGQGLLGFGLHTKRPGVCLQM